MPHSIESKIARIAGRCDLDDSSFDVAISEISCDGCSAEAECEWGEECEFLKLRIDDRIEVNGRVLWHNGRRADIRFFGQIHPAVITELAAAA